MSNSRSQGDTDIVTGDVVMLRKPHPCGNSSWEVTRAGADVGLKCCGCGRVVLLPRHEFRARFRRLIHTAGQ